MSPGKNSVILSAGFKKSVLFWQNNECCYFSDPLFYYLYDPQSSGWFSCSPDADLTNIFPMSFPRKTPAPLSPLSPILRWRSLSPFLFNRIILPARLCIWNAPISSIPTSVSWYSRPKSFLRICLIDHNKLSFLTSPERRSLKLVFFPGRSTPQRVTVHTAARQNQPSQPWSYPAIILPYMNNAQDESNGSIPCHTFGKNEEFPIFATLSAHISMRTTPTCSSLKPCFEHKSITSTTIYVYLVFNGETKAVSPPDRLAGEYRSWV